MAVLGHSWVCGGGADHALLKVGDDGLDFLAAVVLGPVFVVERVQQSLLEEQLILNLLHAGILGEGRHVGRRIGVFLYPSRRQKAGSGGSGVIVAQQQSQLQLQPALLTGFGVRATQKVNRQGAVDCAAFHRSVEGLMMRLPASQVITAAYLCEVVTSCS